MPAAQAAVVIPDHFVPFERKEFAAPQLGREIKNHHRKRGIAKLSYQSLELRDSQNHWRLSVSFCLHEWLDALIARQDFYPIQYNEKMLGADRRFIPTK